MAQRSIVVGVLLILLGLSVGVDAQDGSQIGIWKLNRAKSKFDPPPTAPAPQSVTRTYEVFEGDSVTYTSVTVGADGTSGTPQTYSAHFDGKPYPWKGVPGETQYSSFKRIDAYTLNWTITRAGTVTSTGTNVVSKDGKTLTVTIKGTNAQGQPTSSTQIFEKQ